MPEKDILPEELRNFTDYQGITESQQYFSAFINKLCSMLCSIPDRSCNEMSFDADIHPPEIIDICTDTSLNATSIPDRSPLYRKMLDTYLANQRRRFFLYNHAQPLKGSPPEEKRPEERNSTDKKSSHGFSCKVFTLTNDIDVQCSVLRLIPAPLVKTKKYSFSLELLIFKETYEKNKSIRTFYLAFPNPSKEYLLIVNHYKKTNLTDACYATMKGNKIAVKGTFSVIADSKSFSNISVIDADKYPADDETHFIVDANIIFFDPSGINREKPIGCVFYDEAEERYRKKIALKNDCDWLVLAQPDEPMSELDVAESYFYGKGDFPVDYFSTIEYAAEVLKKDSLFTHEDIAHANDLINQSCAALEISRKDLV